MRADKDAILVTREQFESWDCDRDRELMPRFDDLAKYSQVNTPGRKTTSCEILVALKIALEHWHKYIMRENLVQTIEDYGPGRTDVVEYKLALEVLNSHLNDSQEVPE